MTTLTRIFPFLAIFPSIRTTFRNSVGNGFDRSAKPSVFRRVPLYIYFPGLRDAARRPTGTPAGDSREKCGQLRPFFVVFADRPGLQKSADMPSVRRNKRRVMPLGIGTQ